MSTENTNNDTSLDSAINSALSENPETSNQVEEIEETQGTEETQVETTEEETEEIEISEADLKLLQDIKNPEKRKQTIELLARAEKIIEERTEKIVEEKSGDKPLTDKQVAKTAEQLAREMFGDQYDLLPDKFVDFLETLIEEKLAPISVSQTTVQKALVETEVEKSITKLSGELDGFTALENEMNALIPEIPAKETETIEDYMRRLYRHAKGLHPEKVTSKKETSEEKESEKERKIKIRITRNSKEPSVKGTTPEKVSRSTKAMTLDEAIQEASADLKM